MNKKVVDLVYFVLEQAQDQPVHKRIELYRSLACICGVESEAAQLKALADALEKQDALCREFIFSISQQTKATINPGGTT